MPRSSRRAVVLGQAGLRLLARLQRRTAEGLSQVVAAVWPGWAQPLPVLVRVMPVLVLVLALVPALVLLAVLVLEAQPVTV